jgi:hypothetical protein
MATTEVDKTGVEPGTRHEWDYRVKRFMPELQDKEVRENGCPDS